MRNPNSPTAQQPNSPTMKLLVLALLTGALAGLIGALCGVGGGIIMVPIFVKLLGLTQKQAIATSLAVIIPTAIAATLKNATDTSFIQWKVVGLTAIAAIVAAWFGSAAMKELSNPVLTRVFAVLLILVGIQMLASDFFAKR